MDRLQPRIQVKANFFNAPDIDKVVTPDEADVLMLKWSKDRSCTRFVARGMWNPDTKSYNEQNPK